jgi:hypothetical protein
VLTAKLRSNETDIMIRIMEMKNNRFTISGPRKEIENTLKLFESNPEVKVKYE